MLGAHYKGLILGISHQWPQADQVPERYTMALIPLAAGYLAEGALYGSSDSGLDVSSILATFAVWPNGSSLLSLSSSVEREA